MTTYNQQIQQTNGKLGIDYVARGLFRVNVLMLLWLKHNHLIIKMPKPIAFSWLKRTNNDYL